MLLSPRKNGLTSLFKEVRVLRQEGPGSSPELRHEHCHGISLPCFLWPPPPLSLALLSVSSKPTRICTARFEWVKRQAFPARGCKTGLAQCEATNLGVFDLCHFDLFKRGCANSGTINTNIFAIQKNIPRGINFAKITKNIFQPPAPKETKNTTSVWRCQLILIAAFSYKKIGGPNEFP